MNGRGTRHYPDDRAARRSSEELERRREAARKREAWARAQAPQVPSRPWTLEELQRLFTTEHTLLQFAILFNRNYGDVQKTSAALTRAYDEAPDEFLEKMLLTPVQIKLAGIKYGKTKPVCDECFMTPHDINCSHA